jgi:hypothetical protein
VASGTGAEARAGAGCVGAAPVTSGWSRRRPRARARARAGRRGGAGGRWETLGRRRRHLVAAAEARRRRQLLYYCGGGGWSCERAGETERMKRCGHGASVKILYFRRPPRKPSDISLSPTSYLTAIGHKIMSDDHSDNPRMYRVTSDGCPWPSDISLCPTVS